ncbi:xanthine dehydrogenase small subunit [Zoogloea sp.]|uniref:xanthine dehydrogenase small subunit n=1 Tax=Zoogloea sp. TaxID=49181 RepID=UPI00262A4800|nr:xanthine dehydrogenase small subunit [Zoogloea sp.]MDD3352707.1 xanthine dehydrogenase small subunit [Zoogloea sp.]
MSERPIHFYFRGTVQRIEGVSPTRTLLQYLREDVHVTGTKEGCAEGDCGACTVVLGEKVGDALQLKAVNACIQFLPTLDGKALFTVEDLTRLGERTAQLHPVQQALLDTHASQCGFCTPGFAMSLFALYENNPACPDRASICHALDGNLCRCTGYRPQVDALPAAYARPRPHLDRQAVLAALDHLASLPSLEYRAHGQRFTAPRTLAELATARLAHPEARLLAGATDVGLWVTKQLWQLDALIYLGAVAELKIITRDPAGGLVIGAGASLTDAFAALSAAEPAWTELAWRFASTPVRNAGTLGGNVANGSPIGDSMPGLIALGSHIVLQQGERLRRLPLEDFYLAYQKTALEAGEFLRALEIPPTPPGRVFRTWKVSKRSDQDISAVCGAFALQLADGVIHSARIAFGGMAGTPLRARATEAFLTGRTWSRLSLEEAARILANEFTPLDDLRASAAYRRRVAAGLLMRLWLEQDGSAPARLADLEALT